MNGLVNELPTAVFKMEGASLTPEFAGSTVSDSNATNVTKSEEDMTRIIEAAAGDLDGLLDDAPAADAALAKADAQAENAVAKADDGFTIVFLDDDGNEITEEQFDELNKGCGSGMKKGRKMKKDADGNLTEVEKSGDAGAPKSGGSPGNPVVDGTSDTGAVSLEEGGVPPGMHGFRKEERTMKSFVDGQMVEQTGIWYVNDETKEEVFGGFITKVDEPGSSANAGVVTESASPDPTHQQDTEYTPAEVKLFEALGVMAKSMTEMKETVEKVASRVDDIEKTADEAKETAENTVVVGVAADLDESLATLTGRQVTKNDDGAPAQSDDDIWKGVLPEIASAAQ